MSYLNWPPYWLAEVTYISDQSLNKIDPDARLVASKCVGNFKEL